MMKKPYWLVEDRGYSTPCWIWRGSKIGGYGKMYVFCKQMYAHIFYWSEKNGPVPEGMHIDHLCSVKACVNPDHLRLCTQAENKSSERKRADKERKAMNKPEDLKTSQLNNYVK